MSTTDELVDQIDWHWREQLRPRLAHLSDAEYLWQPVPGAWTVHPAGASSTAMAAGSSAKIDWEWPEPTPAPVPSIAWRLGHMIVGVLAVRSAAHFGGPPASYQTWSYALTAAGALAQLDQEYARWLTGVRGLDDEGLAAPCGPAEGPWADRPMITLVLHINRELIHHGAEVALLRDLYAHQSQ